MIFRMTQQRYRDLAEWPLMGTAVVFLSAYAWQVVARVEGPGGEWLEATLWITWGIFAADYAINLWLADDRRRWFLWNLHELLIVALPVFRPLRLLRLVTLLSVIHRTVGESLRGRVATYVAGSAALLVFVGALAVLDAEQSVPDAKILTFGDALWWAVTTITTVGYGDLYPVTAVGRAVAVALMLSGIAVLGVVTASIATWLVQRVSDTTETAVENAEQPVLAEITELAAEVAALRREIAQLKDAQLEVPSPGAGAHPEARS
jgi:voltage-gated potassium channel